MGEARGEKEGVARAGESGIIGKINKCFLLYFLPIFVGT